MLATCFAIGIVSLVLPSVASPATSSKLSGEITGLVTNPAGVPQMGAVVMLFNRQDRLFQRALTDEYGKFSFANLLPDIYSIRVTLASFVPAIKHNILVQPGMNSILNVNLASLFSTIQLVYPPPENRVLMTDDWKWVLRTASATRPVTRLLAKGSQAPSSQTHHAEVFSDTRGLLRVSAGDGGQVLGFGNEADLGTAFALATSLYGENQLHFSGNVGYGAQTGAPLAAFRTSFSRDVGAGSPEVAVTLRQMFMTGRISAALAGSEPVSLPALRTMSLSFADKTQISDALSFQYGFSLDSVSFLDRLNYFSPYARLTYELGDDSQIDFSYTSGNARPSLGTDTFGPDAELQRDLSALAFFPRISLRGGRAKVQRGQDYEMGYSRKMGSRTFRIAAYREHVSNVALTVSAPEGMYNGEILPDLFSGSSTFNGGNFQTSGYTLSITQDVGQHLAATVTYGSMGALTAESRQLDTASPDDLREMIRVGRQKAITTRVSAVLPWTGTRFVTSYQIADDRWVTAGHMYSTQSWGPSPGLNLYIRQPIPTFSVLPWRMEATADLRNLRAQGYLPLALSDGRRVLLVQMPRSFRGGLSFIF